MSAVFLVLSAFLASAVEMVEALTIVLAAGARTRMALVAHRRRGCHLALAIIVAALGPRSRSSR